MRFYTVIQPETVNERSASGLRLLDTGYLHPLSGSPPTIVTLIATQQYLATKFGDPSTGIVHSVADESSQLAS